jgi:hypothetical protein
VPAVKGCPISPEFPVVLGGVNELHAAFLNESRIEFDNATNLDRKSGVRGMKNPGRSQTVAFAG